MAVLTLRPSVLTIRGKVALTGSTLMVHFILRRTYPGRAT